MDLLLQYGVLLRCLLCLPSCLLRLKLPCCLVVNRCVTGIIKVAGLTLAWNSTCISLACCLLDMVAVVAMA